MKTLISRIFLVFILNGCTVDAFAPIPTDGGTADADAAIPDTDGGATDAAIDTGAQDAAKEASPDSAITDAGPDVNDSGVAPLCAPLGYKPCAGANKCSITAADGTAACQPPGTKATGQACSTDSDCGMDAVCEVSLCRNLCQKTFQTPWGTNNTTWGLRGCGVCPNSGTHYQNPRFPSWLGVCTY